MARRAWRGLRRGGRDREYGFLQSIEAVLKNRPLRAVLFYALFSELVAEDYPEIKL